jgi:Na+-driven multidrug efflux pump
MITARFDISFGAFAIAMSRVGSQVESLTWLVGAGFGSALMVFVGQNYGAGKPDRISEGVRYSLFTMTGWGLFVSSILVFGGSLIYAIFLPDPDLRATGILYCRILAICQVPMNLENLFGNAFKGKGRTVPPSVASITSNIIRVPLAYVLSKTPLGLLGIWAAISFSACMRGAWVTIWYVVDGKKRKKS